MQTKVSLNPYSNGIQYLIASSAATSATEPTRLNPYSNGIQYLISEKTNLSFEKSMS